MLAVGLHVAFRVADAVLSRHARPSIRRKRNAQVVRVDDERSAARLFCDEVVKESVLAQHCIPCVGERDKRTWTREGRPRRDRLHEHERMSGRKRTRRTILEAGDLAFIARTETIVRRHSKFGLTDDLCADQPGPISTNAQRTNVCLTFAASRSLVGMNVGLPSFSSGSEGVEEAGLIGGTRYCAICTCRQSPCQTSKRACAHPWRRSGAEQPCYLRHASKAS